MDKKIRINNFSEFQDYLKAFLLFFDNFCRKNNIEYTVIAGTMLGAVRNKGMIPWDGDVDVALTRKNLAKLKAAFEKYEGRYYLNYPGHFYKKRSKSEQHTFYCRVIDKKCPCPYYLIDVYTIDYLGNDYESAKKGLEELEKATRKLVYGPMFHLPYFEKGKGFKKNALSLLAHIAHPLLFPISWALTPSLLRKVKECEDKYFSFDESSEYEIVEASFGRYQISKKQLLLDGVSDCDFDNFKVKCINNYEYYLTSVYGDYKKLPPIEKRVPYPKLLLKKKYTIIMDDELSRYLQTINPVLAKKVRDL
jgi:lipopolysaccharide cholinephosphotransferase